MIEMFPRWPLLSSIGLYLIVMAWTVTQLWLDWPLHAFEPLHHPAIFHSAQAAMLLWSISWMTWKHQDRRSELWNRTVWLSGAIVFLAHVLIAFEFGHSWSHAQAIDHVESASGFGQGLYVSYIFTLAWTVDAIWFAGWPKAYRHRSRRFDQLFHGFMGFLIFQGTVVFGITGFRWVMLGVFVGIGVDRFIRRWRRVPVALAKLGEGPTPVLEHKAGHS